MKAALVTSQQTPRETLMRRGAAHRQGIRTPRYEIADAES